jgi:hypothetical protein
MECCSRVRPERQYIVKDGVLFVRDPVRRRCGRTPARMLRELYGGL